MKVKVEEKLGAWVAFSKDEVRVNKDLYDKIPQDCKQDFDSVLISACEKYQSSVAEVKSRGERPNSMALKKLATDDVRKWVTKHGFMSQDEKVVVAREPRIPSDHEVTRVVQKQSYFVDIAPTSDEINLMFNNFDSDTLSDERIEQVSSTDIEVDLEDDLFESLDLLDGLDDF